jgi:hypothetical protein
MKPIHRLVCDDDCTIKSLTIPVQKINALFATTLKSGVQLYRVRLYAIVWPDFQFSLSIFVDRGHAIFGITNNSGLPPKYWIISK